MGNYKFEIKEKFEEFLKAIPEFTASDILYAWFRMLRIHHEVILSEGLLQEGIEDEILFNSLYIALERERGKERFAENTSVYDLIGNIGTLSNSPAADWNLVVGSLKELIDGLPVKVKQNINYTIDGKK